MLLRRAAQRATLQRCSLGSSARVTPSMRRSSTSTSPSNVRVAARVARIAGELGLLQLRKARGVDVAIRSVKFRRAFVRLGPAFVKIGQALATRRDVLPPELCDQLSLLQDDIEPSLSGEEAIRVIEHDLKKPIHELFDGDFSRPVASASLGQVYRAKLLTGEEVAVKVQRDDVLELLEVDAVAVRSFVAMISQLFSTETDFAAIADEIVGRIGDELDYAREASDCELFARLYKNADVCVPKVYREFCGPRVLTLSYLPGTKLDEWGRSGPSQDQKKRIIEEGVKCTARQFFEVGFFHADPHPGNLLVDSENRLAYLDFGKMDRLDDDDRFALMSVVVHFANRDAGGLARDFRGLGFVDDTDHAERSLKAALETALSEPRTMFGGKAMSFSGVIAFLRAALPADSSENVRFALPPRFASVVRALGALEGAVLAVDPEFEVVTAAYPHVARALLADRDSRARQALRRLVLDRHGRVRWRRLEALGKSAFSSSDVGSMDSIIVALGGRDAVAGVLTDACDYVCSDAGARTRAALVDDAEAWFTSSESSNNNVWRVFMDAPELVAPVAARAAASHEARRSLGLLAGRLRARHGWRAPASILEAASRALGEAMDDEE